MKKAKKVYDQMVSIGFVLAVLAGIVAVILQLLTLALGFPQLSVDVSNKLLGPIVIFGNSIGFYSYISNAINKKEKK